MQKPLLRLRHGDVSVKFLMSMIRRRDETSPQAISASGHGRGRVAGRLAYPARPMRIIVGYATGDGTDISGRVVGQWLSERLGQQFVVENWSGAATNIATEAVAAAVESYPLPIGILFCVLAAPGRFGTMMRSTPLSNSALIFS